MKNYILPSLLLLSFSACVSTYSDAPIDEANAIVVFEKGYQNNELAGSLMQGYIIYEDGNCNKPKNAASFAFLAGEEKERRVSATKPLVFIYAINEQSVNINSEHLGREVLAETCAFRAEFQPESGKKYSIRQSGFGSNCKLEVTDYETGVAIQGLKAEGAFKTNSPSPKKNYLGYPCE